MKLIFASLLVSFLVASVANAQDIPGTAYPVDPAQQTHADVPKGEVFQFDLNQSKIYPDTKRTIWVYVPAEYDSAKPACLYVDMDGIQFGAPTVFDYLIHTGEMPVTIGVFISSGTLMKDDKDALRYDRSHEFDAMNNNFVDFLLTEVLPEVESKKTKDGRAIHFSKDANDHAIAGASSGAICAFTAAWQRPDVFSRVYSSIGTYVSMRGGDQYPGLIRKTEPKPIRIFLQDGDRDAWNPLFGSWYLANINMEAALSFAGYEVNHAWGHGGHDGVQATAIFPDVMRWLWKGWPQKVIGGKSNNDMLKTILPDSGSWEAVHPEITALAITTDTNHSVLIADTGGMKNEITATGKLKSNNDGEPKSYALAVGPNSTAELQETGDLKVFMMGIGKVSVFDKMYASKAVFDNQGNLYISTPEMFNNGKIETGKIWLVKPGAPPVKVDEGLRFASALTLSPDHKLLLVAEDNTNWIYSYVVNDDGTLKDKERWYWLHQTDNYGYNKMSDLAVDDHGNLYAATNLGVQVCDQNGRVRAILQLRGGPITGLCFGGPDFDTLFVICGGKLYKRKLKVKGVPAWAPPVKVESQGGG
jgi:gluconolactonase